MKILVVSLLRLGDVLLAAPALAGLRRRHPHARIHVLLNREAIGASQLIEGIDRWHIFERTLLQQALADAQTPILEPFFRLDGLLEKLRDEDFDLVLNLTHNRLSGWLCGAIQGRQTIGLALDKNGQPRFGSSWFQFLNDNAHRRGLETFHLSDVFWFGAGLEQGPRTAKWRIRGEAKREAQAICGSSGRVIALQPFASESKKEWSFESWAQALSGMRIQADENLILLAAPAERDKAATFQAGLNDYGVHAQTAVCSLSVAAEVLRRSDLLITADTSIKHLAAAFETPVLEISLGSSDWRRTGVYKPGSYIVQGLAPCAPCPHSENCGEDSHLCGNSISPRMMAELARAILNRKPEQIETLARMHSKQCEIWRTDFAGEDHWQCRPVGRELRPEDLRLWLDKLTTKLMLQGEHLQVLGAYGTAALRLGEWLMKRYPGYGACKWKDLFREIEGQSEDHQTTASDAKRRLQDLILKSRDQSTVDLQDMRALQGRIEETERRLEVRARLVRSLKNVVEGTL